MDGEGIRDSRVDQAYRAIRQRIADGVYRPAERLVEAELARSLAVSRMSVRSAFQRLRQEGLITLEPHRGAKVTALTFEEAMQVVEVREGLEGWAAALAAQRITEEGLANLDRLLSEMERVLREGKPLEYADLNAAFHQAIVDATGNRRLRHLVDVLKAPVVTYQFRIILVPGRGQASLREHGEIVGALRSRCPEMAEAVMRRHISTVRQTMVDTKRLMLVSL